MISAQVEFLKDQWLMLLLLRVDIVDQLKSPEFYTTKLEQVLNSQLLASPWFFLLFPDRLEITTNKVEAHDSIRIPPRMEPHSSYLRVFDPQVCKQPSREFSSCVGSELN